MTSLIYLFLHVSWLIMLISLFFSIIMDIIVSKSKNVSRETFKLLSLNMNLKFLVPLSYMLNRLSFYM